jgi:hypothetical protein
LTPHELLGEPGDNGLRFTAVAFRFGLVAAQNECSAGVHCLNNNRRYDLNQLGEREDYL